MSRTASIKSSSRVLAIAAAAAIGAIAVLVLAPSADAQSGVACKVSGGVGGNPIGRPNRSIGLDAQAYPGNCSSLTRTWGFLNKPSNRVSYSYNGSTSEDLLTEAVVCPKGLFKGIYAIKWLATPTQAQFECDGYRHATTNTIGGGQDITEYPHLIWTVTTNGSAYGSIQVKMNTKPGGRTSLSNLGNGWWGYGHTASQGLPVRVSVSS